MDGDVPAACCLLILAMFAALFILFGVPTLLSQFTSMSWWLAFVLIIGGIFVTIFLVWGIVALIGWCNHRHHPHVSARIVSKAVVQSLSKPLPEEQRLKRDRNNNV